MQTEQSSKRCDLEAELYSRTEKYVKEQPAKAVGAALGIGLVVSLLPLGRIVGMLVDVGFSLVRPILLGAGICKISEWCRPRPVADCKPE